MKKLQPQDFKEIAEHGAFIYCYLRAETSENGKAGTPYYVGQASYASRVYETSHNVPVPKDRERIRCMRQGLDEQRADFWEMFYIWWFGRLDTGTGILRNRTDGGEGAYGRIKDIDELAKAAFSKAERYSKMYGCSIGEWLILSRYERQEAARQASQAKKYGYSPKAWRELWESERRSIAAFYEEDGNGPGVRAAIKYGLEPEEWRKMPSVRRARWQEQYETAKKNGYKLKDWMALSYSERQSFGKLRLNAEKFGLTVEEWRAMTQSERAVYSRQVEHARKYSMPLEQWQALTDSERNVLTSRAQMHRVAAKYKILPEIWVLLSSTARRNISVYTGRGRPVSVARVICRELELLSAEAEAA